MRLAGLALLAAPTARSQAYAQAMAAAGLAPERVLVIGEGPRPERRAATRSAARAPAAVDGLRLPDLGEPLAATCRRAEWVVDRIAAADVNDPAVTAWLRVAAPRLVVYSGFGGQRVGERLITLGPPLLHMHAGWLPNYRGSTTVYYSLIREGGCAVSAILLGREIDTGPIVARRRYGPPPPGLDVDHLYDNAIRADLLVSVLAAWRERGGFAELRDQDPAVGETYYVIHPVLKHLALLSLERRGLR